MGNKKSQRPAEPTEIEPRYITVMSPYPYYANLELPADRLAMARWLACIVVDPAYLHTIWWKPKAAAPLVIVEISRDTPALERLLGEHKWADFLLSPTPDERPLSSKAYFCHYRTAAHLQREGWKDIDVQDAWFDKWRPQNAVVRYPYPQSTWCDLPSMDPTALCLCLNIPREMFGLGAKQAAPKAATLVPGSPAWVAAGNGTSQQQQPKKKTPAAPPKNAWNKPLVTATSSKATTPKVAATPLEDDDPKNKPMGLTGPDLTEANVKQHLRWSDEVEEEERIAVREKEAAAGPLSAGQLATVWPPPPKAEAAAAAASSGGSDDALATPVGEGDDDDDGQDGAWYGAYGLPVLSPEDHKDAVAPPARARDSAGYAGGAGRSVLEARGWTCPVHGPLKNCQIGICEEARAAKRRFARERGRPRDNLAQWAAGGPRVEVRAVGGGEGPWRTANGKGQSKSARSHGASAGAGPAEGAAWRSKSAVRVR